MGRLSDFRQVYAQIVMARAGLAGGALREAIARIPRHEFLPRGPWQLAEEDVRTESDDPALVYQDLPWGLVPDQRIPTGQPSLHARCMAACALRPGARVVHVGAGAGYYTAILAELVGPSGQVLGLEIDQALAQIAATNLAPWPWARIEAGSGVDAGFDAADVIYVSAGVEKPPRRWFELLRPQGRLLLPLTPQSAPVSVGDPARVEYAKASTPGGLEGGGMFVIREQGSNQEYSAEFLCRARFVACVAAQDETARGRLVEAFRTETCGQVRSLRLSPTEPDPSAWFVGSGFWLSTSPVGESGEPVVGSRV